MLSADIIEWGPLVVTIVAAVVVAVAAVVVALTVATITALLLGMIPQRGSAPVSTSSGSHS